MIRFRDFSKRFGAVDAVVDFTFDVAAGEVVALLGPNGSGKTTSIKAAAGLIRPTGGTVLVGEPGRPSSDAEARRSCAFLPQHVAFPATLTGREVVEFYGSLRGRSAAHVAEALRFSSLNGASARVVGTYSGGMRQRLGLAVAVVSDAPVLLLDEPTAALDPEGLCAFYELVEAHRHRGRAVLFSSHQMGDVERLADRFAVLVGGRLVKTLTARELATELADRGVMRVTVERRPETLIADVRRLAPKALWAADQLIVPAPTAARLAVLDLVRASGAGILGLSAEEGRLDAFYREVVGARP
jgi:Cu-processing system ATP-binding protein